MNNKYRIGITGSIGSGKSYFCNILEKEGYPLLRADEISKEILASDPEIRIKIIKEFGEDSFIQNEINTKFLASQVFSDPSKVILINSILHPSVITKISDMMSEILKTNKVVFVESALIYEADIEQLFDYVVLITADPKIRMKRKKSAGLSEVEFTKRSDNQIPDEEKKKRADFIFTNDGSIEELVMKSKILKITLNI